MKAIVLAAGYGTRLGALTASIPKPLLEVAGRPILDFLFDWLAEPKRIDEVLLVCNEHYFSAFEKWKSKASLAVPVRLLNDGSTSKENRLGAIGDLEFALNCAKVNEPTLVVGADNVSQMPLATLLAFFDKKSASVITYTEPPKKKLSATGVLSFAEDGRVTSFEEKPKEPRSSYAAPPLYLFTAQALQAVLEFRRELPELDAPGHFLAWLHTRIPLYACPLEGERLAIDDAASLAAVDSKMRGLPAASY